MKQLIMVFAAIGLVLAMVLTGCPATTTPTPSETATPTPTATAEPTATPTPTATPVAELSYNCLSPRGIALPVTIVGLAKRLDTFDGKLIYVNQGEADPIIMPAVWERVQKDFPKTTWKYIATSGFGPTTPEIDVVAAADAVIRGIAW